MKKLLVCFLISGLLAGGHFPKAFGQATDKILFGGIHPSIGVGRYSPIQFGAGVSVRFQYPLTPKIALTAKVGFEAYRINLSSLNPYSYLGYGYNPITGFGFNTLNFNYAIHNSRITGLNLPLTVGPRIYVTDRIYGDLGAGADVAANEVMKTSLRVEPGVGYILPLKNGGFLDVNASFTTGFVKGGNLCSLGISYGFKIR